MKFNARKVVSSRTVFLIAGALATVSAVSAQAYEYNETNAHAAGVDATVAGGSYAGGIVSKYLGKETPALTTKVLQETEIGERLTTEKIDDIMAAIKSSTTSMWKVGDRGGGELRIVLDLNQYENYVAADNVDHLADTMNGTAKQIVKIDQTLNGPASTRTRISGVAISERPSGVAAFSSQIDAVNRNFKPRWGSIPKPINVAKSGFKGTRAQLEQIMASGARIQKISLHSLASRALLPNGLHALGVASVVPTASHLMSAIYHGGKSLLNNVMNENDAVCRPEAHCKEPGFIQKAAISTAPVPAWLPIPGTTKDAR